MAIDTPFGRVDEEVLVLSALTIGFGGFLVFRGLKGADGPTIPTRPPMPGDTWGIPSIPGFDTMGQLQITLSRQNNPQQPIVGPYLKINSPQVTYTGPASGREAFASAFIVQKQPNGVWAPVYGSGVANAGMHNISGNPPQLLVRADQLQPDGTHSPQLWLYPWPGTSVGPVCGAAPVDGPGTVVLAVYGLQNDACFLNTTDPLCAPDMDGFASPTCSGRLAVAYKVWRDKVMFHYV